MFKTIFAEIYKKNADIECLGVWGKDGLELEKIIYSTHYSNIDLIGAEMAAILSQIDTFNLTSDKFYLELSNGLFKVVIFSLTPDFFLLVFGKFGMITGKLRFYVDLIKPQLNSFL